MSMLYKRPFLQCLPHLYSESKFITNNDLNYFCIIHCLCEINKEHKEILYFINTYQKENPRLLNPAILDFLVCCLNIQVKYRVRLSFSCGMVTLKQGSGCGENSVSPFLYLAYKLRILFSSAINIQIFQSTLSTQKRQQCAKFP